MFESSWWSASSGQRRVGQNLSPVDKRFEIEGANSESPLDRLGDVACVQLARSNPTSNLFFADSQHLGRFGWGHHFVCHKERLSPSMLSSK
jgi:hypothetical protein